MMPPVNTQHSLEDRLQRWLSDWLAKQRLPTAFQVLPLAGDGSPRPFYRIQIPGKTFVFLSEPAWTLSKDYPVHQAYLQKAGLPVPKFLAVDPGIGALLMEDLGDELLQMRLLSKPDQKARWMQGATELLARLHGSTFPVPSDLPVSQRSFDAEKYTQEMAFTLEHLHAGLLKLPALSAKELASVRTFCETIAAFGPQVFCHRDYHTRNLLVHDEKLRLIDFQDARLGPIEYDLASLFFDAYVPIAESDRRLLLAAYRKVLAGYPLDSKIDWTGFDERLHLVAYQRVVKAAGSFASFFTRYGKKTHLPYLVPALKMAQGLEKKLGGKAPKLPLDLWIRKAEEAK